MTKINARPVQAPGQAGSGAGAKKPLRRFLPLFLVLAACDNWNLPLKDSIAFLSAMTPVSSWEELRNAVEHTDAQLIALAKSFPAGSATIRVSRPLTITAAPGVTAVITRPDGFPTDIFFEVNGSSGDLTLGRPEGGTLVLDGGAVPGSPPLIKVVNRSCTMQDGTELRNNHTNGTGGGVFVDGGAFTMNGGTISGNTSASGGGGVYVAGTGSFTMNGGTISGNRAERALGSGSGGGVYVTGGRFIMNGGTISGNTATGNGGYGGGVYVDSGGAFTKAGGVIYGTDVDDDGMKNRVKDNDGSEMAAGHGHAVYVSSSPVKWRESTAGEGDALDSAEDEGWVL
ncbi:MAG: hypothetical protein LBE02_01825 [Spirochaetaceae bacterium]|jgi:hypothetical protein|nr:hypothetical protein [Spirochaetaceae bacterium]